MHQIIADVQSKGNSTELLGGQIAWLLQLVSWNNSKTHTVLFIQHRWSADVLYWID